MKIGVLETVRFGGGSRKKEPYDVVKLDRIPGRWSQCELVPKLADDLACQLRRGGEQALWRDR